MKPYDQTARTEEEIRAAVDALMAQMEAHVSFELAPVFLAVPAVWMQISNQGTAYFVKGQYGYMEGGV